MTSLTKFGSYGFLTLMLAAQMGMAQGVAKSTATKKAAAKGDAKHLGAKARESIRRNK